jgi:hypothetical protein
MGRQPEMEKVRRPAMIKECSGTNKCIMVRFVHYCFSDYPDFLLPSLAVTGIAGQLYSGVTVVRQPGILSDDHTTQMIGLTFNNQQAPKHRMSAGGKHTLIRNIAVPAHFLCFSSWNQYNHTQMCWNGFPLNSQQWSFDLSPTGFMQTVSVTHGASGSRRERYLWGFIALNNVPDWSNNSSTIPWMQAASELLAICWH